jgi:DNA-binding FrmR family transcriptional regulator
MRLRRVEGQVRGLQHMVERGDRCIDVFTQIAAVREALGAVGRGLLDREIAASSTPAHPSPPTRSTTSSPPSNSSPTGDEGRSDG